MTRLLVAFLRPYRRELALVVLLLLVQALANLYLPTLNARIIDDGVAKGDTSAIVRIGGAMLAVTLAMGAAAIVGVHRGARIAMSLGRDVRGALFRRVQTFSQMEVNRFGTPSLITRTTNDVQQLQMLVLMSLTVMVLAPLMMVGGIVMALRMNARLSLLLAVILPVMGAFIWVVVRTALPRFRRLQDELDRINRVMREALAGVRVIRAFDRAEHEARRFDEANRDLTATSLRVTRIFAVMMPAIMLVVNLSTVGVMWFGSILVSNGDMPIGHLTAFLTYLLQILFSVLMATILLVMVPRAAAAAERIQAVLDVESSVRDPRVPAPAPPRRGVVELRGVGFRYPGADEPVLSGVSFRADPGQVTAIVGGTGSGKSTLVQLIPRFADVTEGQVLVDGIDVRELAQQELWSRIGLVPQRAFLFAGTVASNVRHGDEGATDEEVWRALEIAQARGFVEEMTGGLDAPIAQGGANVSGGQRQRLAIARALAKAPEILIFDDSFSALDLLTDARLRAALRRVTRDTTVIVVAQRVGTIVDADRIVVLADGGVVGIGTHEELLATCETYREIVSSQLSPEEVA